MVLLQYSLKLILEYVGLDNNDSLGFEDFIDLDLSLAESPYKYKLLSSAVWSPGSMELSIGTKNAMVLPEPLAALMRILNFFLSGLTVTSKVYDCTLVGTGLQSS
jgi:hypothetical protein